MAEQQQALNVTIRQVHDIPCFEPEFDVDEVSNYDTHTPADRT